MNPAVSRPRLALWAAALLALARPAAAADRWFATAYAAQAMNADLGKTFAFGGEWKTATLAALAVGREVGDFLGLGVELEGQAVKHFGMQHHTEWNGLFALRWPSFPWDRWVDTSVAVGEGLSYATRRPPLEEELHEHQARLLNYLLFEFTFALPDVPEWSLAARIHHRSGAWGTFDGVKGGSNFWGMGLRHIF